MKILPLGDSITHGDPNSYRKTLYDLIIARINKFIFVGSERNNPANERGGWCKRHEGHPGWTTQDIDESFDDLTKRYDVDIALIHLGTNDILGFPMGQYDVDVSEKHLRSIIAKLRSKNDEIDIYVAQILPIFDEDIGIEETDVYVQEWNARIDSVAAGLTTTASPIVTVDMYTGFTDADFPDGIHPSQNAVEEMARRWNSALRLD